VLGRCKGCSEIPGLVATKNVEVRKTLLSDIFYFGGLVLGIQ